MPATISSPPPAAAPKPAAPTAPPKSPDKPTTIDAPIGNEPSPESYLGDDMAEFTEMDQADEASKRGEPAPKRDEKTGKFVKPADKATQKPQDKPEPEKASETPPESEKPVDEPKPGTMRALGKAHDDLVKKVNTEYQPKIQSLEAKTKEYERQIEELRTKQPDLKPLQDKVSALEKERQQLLEVVRFADYRKSPEFAEKYEKPYNEAWTKAMFELGQVNIVSEDGTTSKFTSNDLLSLANASVEKSDELIEKWFTRATTQQRVLGHVNEIRRLADAQDRALEEARKGAGEFHTNRENALKQSNQAFTQAYNGATTELTKKYSKWFAPDETDPQGNEILKKGFDYADTVFSSNGNALTPEQKAGRLAVIRAKAANHDRLVSRLKNTERERDEYKAKLAQFEASEPPTDDAGNPREITGPRDFATEDAEELEKLARKGL